MERKVIYYTQDRNENGNTFCYALPTDINPDASIELYTEDAIVLERFLTMQGYVVIAKQ